jgi:hypothetical protein
MQNTQIWKSIEALCNEAESVIRDDEPVITVIQSIAPPALAHQRTASKTTLNVLLSKPAPPKAIVVDKSTSQENVEDAPLSPATMTEIAAAIDRASQSAQKPQIMNQPSQVISDQLRKDLMIEVSLAVRSVLANELPKIVRHAISESLYEFVNSSANPLTNKLKALETKPAPKDKKKKVSTKKNVTQAKTAPKEAKAKKRTNKKHNTKHVVQTEQ